MGSMGSFQNHHSKSFSQEPSRPTSFGAWLNPLRWFSRRRDRWGTSRILRQGKAQKVIFFYSGEEGTYMDQADVTLFENGIVFIASEFEETTVHLSNCEILWRYDSKENHLPKIRLLQPGARQPEAEFPSLSSPQNKRDGSPVDQNDQN